MTYAALSTLVQNTLQNTETTFVASMPTFVANAESRIYNTVRTPDQRLNATGTITTGNNTIALTYAVVEPLVMKVTVSGVAYFPLLKSKGYIEQAYGDTQDTPRAYAIVGGVAASTTVMIGPKSAATMNVSLDYIGTPPSLVTETSGTWLSKNFPDVLTYATFLEGHIYMKGEQAMQEYYQSRFNEALMALQRSLEGLATTDEYQGGLVSVPVNG